MPGLTQVLPGTTGTNWESQTFPGIPGTKGTFPDVSSIVVEIFVRGTVTADSKCYSMDIR